MSQKHRFSNKSSNRNWRSLRWYLTRIHFYLLSPTVTYLSV